MIVQGEFYVMNKDSLPYFPLPSILLISTISCEISSVIVPKIETIKLLLVLDTTNIQDWIMYQSLMEAIYTSEEINSLRYTFVKEIYKK